MNYSTVTGERSGCRNLFSSFSGTILYSAIDIRGFLGELWSTTSISRIRMEAQNEFTQTAQCPQLHIIDDHLNELCMLVILERSQYDTDCLKKKTAL